MMKKVSLRRRAEQWAELVAEYNAGSESEQGFCQRHGLVFTTFRKWRYRLSTTSKARQPSPPQPSFVEVLPRSGVVNDKVTVRVGEDITLEYPVTSGVEAMARLILALRDGR